MMERRRALTIPFDVEKDNLLENPFRIPKTCVSPEAGKFEKQVSWTEFAGRKRKSCDSQHKNGSVLFGHNHSTKVSVELNRKNPCLILTDILKTDHGKAYLQRIKETRLLRNRGHASDTQTEHDQCKEQPQVCRERRLSQRAPSIDKKPNGTPNCNQKTSSSPSQRSRPQRRLHNADDDLDKEEKDTEEVITGKDCEEEVVDCGLSVSWEPAENTGDCKEFPPPGIKDRWTDPEKEVQPSAKRKRNDAVRPQCNGTASPKHHRQSVLRLSGEDGRDGVPAPKPVCVEEIRGDGDLESLDRGIVQFTVGADDPTDVVVPSIGPPLEAGDIISNPRLSLPSSQHSTTKSSPSEPIVLSSDDEESADISQHCSPAVHTLVTMKDALLPGESLEEDVFDHVPSVVDDMQLLRVVVDLPPMGISLMPDSEYSCMAVAFSNMYCGGYRGRSVGEIMIEDDKMLIPISDINEQVEVMLTVERKELRRYSVWDQHELEAQQIHLKCFEEPCPPAVLLLCVSETAAAAVQQDLLKLRAEQDEAAAAAAAAEKGSTFILLSLKDPLEGMEGALFRSLLDIDCLNSLADEESLIPYDADGFGGLESFNAPVLSLEDSLKLMRRTGTESHLLSLMGLEDTDQGLSTNQEEPLSDVDEYTAPLVQMDVYVETETTLEPEAATEEESQLTGTQLKPEEEQKEEPEQPSEEKKKEPAPLYTLCHRRTKGSYCVSLCEPDTSWIKYKHQGLAHRLIQFPPPPLKGGITVTMEDLQCLDSGQFLNDVIIDFYLKYLLHKASASVNERSHIFSSFFYKQLTRRDNASEGNGKDSCQRQRRHQRVKTWTRHVDIFKKDFLFVPVNQEAHWYLVVICFPGLLEPKSESWDGPDSHMGRPPSETGELQDQESAQGPKSPSDDTASPSTPPTSNPGDGADAETEAAQKESTKDSKPQPVSCTEKTCGQKTIWKRPCILVMDSLKRSLHERVFKLLREYLESEWEARRGSVRDFSPEQMQSSHCQVPLQDNSSDCGLYLLQYVESFLEDPVVHFDLPLQLERWFPRQQVRRKRDEIRDLVLNLYRRQNLDSTR